MLKQVKSVVWNAASEKYDNFAKTKAFSSLQEVRTLVKIKKKIADYFPKKFILHGDQVYAKVFELVGKKAKASSIVETGTYLGWSTEFFTKIFPDIVVYTCEINEEFYLKAKKNFKSFRNIYLYKDTSPEFLNLLLNKEVLGKAPFFFIDAHWGDNWPLEEEVHIISNRIKSAIFIIDDFKVPGDSRFGFDEYGGKECSLDMITPHINKKNEYNLLFPNYGWSDAFRKDILHPNVLQGYVIIFQNMPKAFMELKKDSFIRKYFIEGKSVGQGKEFAWEIPQKKNKA